MADISRDEVQHLATLSSLALSSDELAAMQTSIATILDHIATLGELDTSGVEPTYQVTDLEFVARPDTVQESTVTPSDLLTLAPDVQNHQIKVPKVL